MTELVNLEGLISLLNIDDRKALERHCKDLVIHSSAFAGLILGAQAGVLAPYRYANHFDDRVPEHLHPTDKEVEALGKAKAGPATGAAKKFISKTTQMFEEWRLLAAHILYTPDHDHWHLFYFDQRDRDEEDNHWKHGAHIHYTSSLCVSLPFETILNQVQSGNFRFPKSFHLRYVDSRANRAA